MHNSEIDLERHRCSATRQLQMASTGRSGRSVGRVLTVKSRRNDDVVLWVAVDELCPVQLQGAHPGLRQYSVSPISH